MIRKKNLYSRPKKAFEISRIKEENILLEKYGLKKKIRSLEEYCQSGLLQKKGESACKIIL